MQFDHVGIPTGEKKPGEVFVEATRVWATDFQRHPYGIEWLRYEADSPVTGLLRSGPHVAFRVGDVAAAGRGMKTLLEPFDAGPAFVGFYETDEGAVIELMQYERAADAPDQRRFEHVGLLAPGPMPGEQLVASTRLWRTNWQEHPYRIEWLRFEAGSPVPALIRQVPHVAYRTDDIRQAGQGLEVLLEPFDVGPRIVAFFKTGDGAVVEFIQHK